MQNAITAEMSGTPVKVIGDYGKSPLLARSTKGIESVSELRRVIVMKH
jgi:hypothetical protein